MNRTSPLRGDPDGNADLWEGWNMAEKENGTATVEAEPTLRDRIYERMDALDESEETRAGEGLEILKKEGFIEPEPEVEENPEGEAEPEAKLEPEVRAESEPESETPDARIERMEAELAETKRAMQARIDELTADRKREKETTPEKPKTLEDAAKQATEDQLHQTVLLANQLFYGREELGIPKNSRVEDMTDAERAELVRVNSRYVRTANAEIMARSRGAEESKTKGDRDLADAWAKSWTQASDEYAEHLYEKDAAGAFKKDAAGSLVVKAKDPVVQEIQATFEKLKNDPAWSKNPELPSLVVERVLKKINKDKAAKAQLEKLRAKRETEKLKAGTRGEVGVSRQSIVKADEDKPQTDKEYLQMRREQRKSRGA